MCITIIVAVTFGTIAFSGDNLRALNNGPDQRQLQLTKSIVKERYCSDVGARFLEWTLNLKYTNDGPGPVLLDKKSSRVSRTFVSTNLKKAAAGRYVSAPIPIYDDLGPLGYQPHPDPSTFIVLKPMESFTVEANSRVSVYDGTKETKGDLHSGKYFLQVKAVTWRYYADPKEYRDKWIDKGYLWAEVVTSEPMQFTIEKQPKVVPCSQ